MSVRTFTASARWRRSAPELRDGRSPPILPAPPLKRKGKAPEPGGKTLLFVGRERRDELLRIAKPSRAAQGIYQIRQDMLPEQDANQGNEPPERGADEQAKGNFHPRSLVASTPARKAFNLVIPTTTDRKDDRMFTIKMVYRDHDRVLSAAEYKQRGKHLNVYPPRLDAVYVLSGQVEHEIELDDPNLVNVFVINAMGKTVDRLSAYNPQTDG